MIRPTKNKLSTTQRIERYNRAMNGDTVALMECAYDGGICTKEQRDDFYRIKRQVEEAEEQEQM